MPSLNCILVDDEPHSLEVLRNYIARTPELSLCGEFRDAESASASGCLPAVDVAFLDVDMPGMNGLDLAIHLPQKTIIVFTTAYREYAADAYEQAAADYLLKPFSYERFLRCINQIQKSLPLSSAQQHLFLKDTTKGQTVQINLEEVIYISAERNHLDIHLPSEKVRILSGITRFNQQLPPNFCRIHRSYIINIQQIDLVAYDMVTLQDGTLLPVGRNYHQLFREALRT